MLFCSEEPHTHYSVFKIASILDVKIIRIKANENGEISLIDFEEKLLELKSKRRYLNAVLLLNCGTTLCTAFDDVKSMRKIMD